MLDGTNKDTTMESDFIGMFNPVRGLRKNNGLGGAFDDEFLGNIEERFLKIETKLPIDFKLSGYDLLKYKPQLTMDNEFLETLDENERQIYHKNLGILLDKYRNIGTAKSIVINVKQFSEKNIQVHFNSKRAKYSNIRVAALDVLGCMDFIESLYSKNPDEGIPEEAYNKQNYETLVGMITDSYQYLLNVQNPCTGIDFQNHTYITGTVAYDKNIIVKGDNTLTGSYNNETDEFSIYINGQLFAKLQNMSHWGYKIKFTDFDAINYVEYPYQDIANNNPELNLTGFGGYKFSDVFGISNPPVRVEIYWQCGIPDSFVESLVNSDYVDFPYILEYFNILSDYYYLYFCEQEDYRFGLVAGALSATCIKDEDLYRNVIFTIYSFLNDIKHENTNSPS